MLTLLNLFGKQTEKTWIWQGEWSWCGWMPHIGEDDKEEGEWAEEDWDATAVGVRGISSATGTS